MTEGKKECPQDRWNQKNNLITKTYSLNKDTVDAFREACDAAGVSQSAQLTKMMMESVEKTEARK